VVWSTFGLEQQSNTHEVGPQEIAERNLKIIFEFNLFSTWKEKKCGKQQQPAQHQICRQNIRHRKFLSKHQI